MDLTLILFIIGFLLVAYLIFKLIKKVVFAVISIVAFAILVIGGIFGLVYLDFNQLANQNNFNVDLIYSNNGNYILGTSIAIENKSLNMDKISTISSSDLSALDVNSIKKDDNLFVVLIDEKIFLNLTNGKTFTFNEFKQNAAFSEFDIQVTGEQAVSLLNSKTASEDFVEIILKNNGLTGTLKDVAKPVGVTALNSELEKLGVSFKEVLFLEVLKESLADKQSVLTLLKSYKNTNGVEVYPDRFTFKLVRYIPISTIETNLQSILN